MSNDLGADEKARINSLEEEIEELQEENRKLAAMFCKKVDECAEFEVAFHRIKAACEKLEATYSAVQRQRDTLKAEVEKFNQRTNGYDAVIRSADCTIKVLTNEVEKLRNDAERYQHVLDWQLRAERIYRDVDAVSFFAQLRAKHDAAMKETK